MVLFKNCEIGWSPSCVHSWFSLIWTAVTVPLYISVLIVLLKYRNTEELKHAFFSFMISLGVADMLNMCHGLLLYRPAYLFGWYPELYLWGQSRLVRFIHVVGTMSGLAQSLGCLLIACNRFTALVTPMKHSGIWTPNVALCCIIGQWALALSYVVPHIFWVQFELHDANPNSTDNQFYLWWSYIDDAHIGGIVSGAINTIIGVALVVLYAALFVKACGRQEGAGAQQNGSSTNLVALKLALCGLMVTVFLFVRVGMTLAQRLIWYLFNIDIYMFNILVMGWVADFYGGLNPYILLAMSTATREKFKMLYMGKKPQQNLTASSRAKSTTRTSSRRVATTRNL